MEKVIIVAMDEKRVIGKNGDIPWHYPEDMKHFREKTTGNAVLMGRKTYFSIPEEFRPLEDRKNIVLTGSNPDLPGKVEKAGSLEEAWRIGERHSEKLFIAGGSSVYRQTMEEADRMMVTRIHEEYDGDSYFPEWKEENWREVSREDGEELSFIEYERT